MPIEEIPIPDERKAILIGKDGKTKDEIETKTETKIQISDSVRIQGKVDGLLKAQNIIQAIARGFCITASFPRGAVE